MGSDGINLYSTTAQTLDTGSWGELDLDTSRHADTDWTADTTAHDIAQDVDGTVILIGNPTAKMTSGSYRSWLARLEVDTGGGFAAVTGTETRAWSDSSFGISTAAVFSAHAGSTGYAYRIGHREDSASAFQSNAVSSNLCGFYAPDDACWAIGASDVGGSATYVDITLTGTGGLVEGSFSVSSNEVVLPSTDNYLILYRARVERDNLSDQSFSIRLSSDTGGGHAAITGTELSQHTSYRIGSADSGASVAGVLIYSGTASEKIKLQGKTDGANCDFIAEGCSVLVMRLPSGAEFFSGYESSAATPGTSYTAVDMDAQFVTPSGFTHSTSTNPERVTLPSATTTCLVLGVFTGADTSGTGTAAGTIYRDLTGTPTEITAAYGWGTGYNSGTTHTSFSCLIDSFTSADVLGLYGKVSASAGAVANSQLTILRLDNLAASSGVTVTPSAPTVAFTAGSATVAAGSSTHAATAPSISFTAADATVVLTGDVVVTPSAPSISFTAGSATVAAGSSTHAATAPTLAFSAGTATVAAGTSTHAASAPAVTFTAGAATVVPGASNHAATAPAVAFTAGAATVAAGASNHAAAAPSVSFTAGAATVAAGASTHAALAPSVAFSVADAVAAPGTSAHAAAALSLLWSAGAATVAPGASSHVAIAPVISFTAGLASGIALSTIVYDAGTAALVRTVSGTVSADRTVAETVAALRTITGTVERY